MIKLENVKTLGLKLLVAWKLCLAALGLSLFLSIFRSPVLQVLFLYVFVEIVIYAEFVFSVMNINDKIKKKVLPLTHLPYLSPYS